MLRTPNRSAQQEQARKTRRQDIALFHEAKKRHAQGGFKWTHIANLS